MRTIPIQNTTAAALVDDIDYGALSQFKWYLNNKGYAATPIRNPDGATCCFVLMHKMVLMNVSQKEIHHKNGKLDNRRSSLEVLTSSEHNWKKGPNKRGTSKYKGVSFVKRDGVFTAHITKGTSQKNLGSFIHEVDAAKAYDTAAREWFGPGCYLNFP